jgi:hypothetical protein
MSHRLHFISEHFFGLSDFRVSLRGKIVFRSHGAELGMFCHVGDDDVAM